MVWAWIRKRERVHWAVAIALLSGFVPGAALAQSLNQQMALPAHTYNNTRGEPRSEGDRLVRLAAQQVQDGSLDKAITSWQQALEFYHRAKDVESQAVVYDSLGMAYARLGRLQDAEDVLRRRLAISRDLQDFRGQVYGFNNLGTLLLQRGSVAEAERSFAEGLTIAQNINDEAGQGLSWSNLGRVAYSRGDYPRAIKQLETALSLRRFSSDPVGEANTLNNLGDAYRATGNYRLATTRYYAALQLGRRIRDDSSQFRAIDGLIATNQSLGRDGVSSRELLDRRIALNRDKQDPQRTLQTLGSLARYYKDQGDYALAENLYREAIGLARQLEDRRTEVSLIQQLSNLPPSQ